MLSKKYLVTGGTGFIGVALVTRLVKEGCRVRVLDNDLRGSASRLATISDKIEIFSGDIRNLADVEKACEGIDCVFHLAYLNGTEFFYTKPELVLEIAVKGMMNIIDACLKHGIKELFLASSSEVYQTPPNVPTDETVALSIPNPLNPRYSYGGGKIICELMALNYGRKNFSRVIVFRPHNVYGPDMGFEHVIPQFALRMKKLCRETPGIIPFPIEGNGLETRSFVYIDDFIDGLMILLGKGEHLNIYHIGTRDEVTIAEVAQTVASCFNKEISLVPGPIKPGGTLRRCPDISKLETLGYSPKTSLADGVALTVKWYESQQI
ncbi:MAG TPA: SDR family NAD(P)-dependent oxidoreductase [Chlamydiales bacterium]|nr:SDR family NAD(P)-dependent oxidoreductase [Chlamydiales bacterium]